MTKSTNIQEASVDILKTLDFIIGIDTSGSTSKPSHRLKNKSRFQEMQEMVGAIAREAQTYDDDGLTVVQFASHARVFDGVKADKVDTVFNEFKPNGNTNLAECIREIGKKAKASTKNTVAAIFTDGEANDDDDVVAAIKEVAQLKRPKIGIVIVQVGDDPDAATFLERLDNKLEESGIPDIISTVNEEEADNLTLANLVWLAQNA